MYLRLSYITLVASVDRAVRLCGSRGERLFSSTVARSFRLFGALGAFATFTISELELCNISEGTKVLVTFRRGRSLMRRRRE